MSRIPFSLSYIKGDAHHRILALHEKYGEVVRIAPDELIFCYPEAFTHIMGHRKRGEEENGKDPDFWREDTITLTGSNGERHRRVRRILSHAFSAQAMAEQQPLIKQYVNLLIERLKTVAEGGQPQEMTGWYNWTTFDIIGDLAYGDPFGCLETSSYHPWIKLIFKHLNGMAINNSVSKFPLARFLLKFFTPKRIVKDVEQHHEFNKAKVAKRLSVQEPRPDFMQCMINAREKNVPQPCFLHRLSTIVPRLTNGVDVAHLPRRNRGQLTFADCRRLRDHSNGPLWCHIPPCHAQRDPTQAARRGQVPLHQRDGDRSAQCPKP
jgi:cytochrome P450